jgi:hypothetical protein
MELRELIRRTSRANPLWGAPRIHGELLKLGLTVSQATVSKYVLRQRKPPSQTWRAFLTNHAKDLIAVDFFTVPTATFRILFVLVVLSLGPVTVAFAVRFGEPVEQIVEEAEVSGATLIAMATHRRTGIARIVKGSVAERVERTTTIPVMLVQYGT